MPRSLFWRQFSALMRKNVIVLSKHPWLNVVRCILLPIGYGIFLAAAQFLLFRPNNDGLGTAVPVQRLSDQYDGSLTLLWADGTNGAGSPSAEDIMAHITSGFNPWQLSNVQKVDSPSDVAAHCPENWSGQSQCFGALIFNSLPDSSNVSSASQPYNYTLRVDYGLEYINVLKHTSSYEQRMIPLQWAVDNAIIELTTNISFPAPLEWPFTQETNAEQDTDVRLSFVRGTRNLIVLALFICYIGIAYQLPGSVMFERATQLTSHMKAMGLMDSARIISWHLTISLIYIPAWTLVSVIWHFQIFTGTNTGLVFAIHLLLGLSLASWSFFASVPFGRSPQLAAIASTVLAIGFAVLALVFQHASTVSAFIYSLFFPPGFYIFAIRAVCGFEVHQIPTSVIRPDPDNHLRLLPLIFAAIINIFLWPCIAVLLERYLYDAHNPSKLSWHFWGKQKRAVEDGISSLPAGTAISIRNLGKDFRTSTFRRNKGVVTAVADLSLDIPKTGIYVLLGSNGAGKSTTMSILAGLLGRTRGTVLFEGGAERPPLGTIGLVPQKNVLFPELTCYETLRLWQAIKPLSDSSSKEDIEQLLHDCDLGKKVHYNANALSGGQKRKLQLAIGLVGGSKILLVDECTSGVDPLSRRALWRTLTSVRHERTIVFTTHFLDEADLLADTIAILAAPGKLVAQGTPVALKSQLGEGYAVHVTFPDDLEEGSAEPSELLERICLLAPFAFISTSTPNGTSYQLRSRDSSIVHEVLKMLEMEREEGFIDSYSVQSASIEDVFLTLMHSNTETQSATKEKVYDATLSEGSFPILGLTNGRKRSPVGQALTVFHKRILIARRSWLTPLLLVLIAVGGACAPLFFISGLPAQTCVQAFPDVESLPLYAPYSPVVNQAAKYGIFGAQVLASPPGILSTLGRTMETVPVYNISNNATFVEQVHQNYLSFPLGGVSFDLDSSSALVAWQATPPGFTSLTMLNLASNVFLNHAVNASGKGIGVPRLIMANLQRFAKFNFGETLDTLKWVAFYGAAMSAFPAFFSLYVSKERRSSVQAMQFSNGLSNPVGLWLGHLMFDSIFSLIVATVMIIIFATVSTQFAGLGLFWVVLVLYGVAAALFSYCVSLAVNSPLAAFALSAGYQIVTFLLYFAAHLIIVTYANVFDSSRDLSIIHFTLSVTAPVVSAVHAAFVSVNLFSLLCDGNQPATLPSMGQLSRFGGPILYLIGYSFALFAILVWVDSGSIRPRRLKSHKRDSTTTKLASGVEELRAACIRRHDVDDEAAAAAKSNDALRVLNVVKAYGSPGNKVVDDVSFGVPKDTIFALLGPNGAGKTTTFNMIRGDVIPNEGDVLINDVSIVNQPRAARLSLGVCPQFTAIDTALTVREHLMIYGRLKGLYRGEEVQRNVHALMHATSLDMYADRLATSLSGGNQRKLALAIALIGNPSVVLIDEFSTGIDAKMKRDMWATLRTVARGKAIVITTHSMEEASALANKVGILAKKILAVGTTESLAERYATYEVHFSCRSREEVALAEKLMAQVPGARMADDVATRFEVPIGHGMSLAKLFGVLSAQKDFEYTVERATLESVFLKVIRENDVLEEDTASRTRRWWRLIF
ncbi:P-loop containing nucleoside triphosphate hydrolase protein [Laetiporus sulphureus 93-53]|uniref:p-loop containing nucleoside triphosphate hydrolase protein n=1 Tax=Laetiporus sulphureus 93-53 TaxID=1314785 RepID=A0A165BIW9_9APHY|nr:P-loop containing nucleoside triphosphate hydrolase protein [Laetiporus sulphureus 93-53]KZT01143.1 P-loop containing nucleoside triphosphate hydrolase protein [Laetiporus sulphureus 93-53]